MIEEAARVVSIEGDYAWVETSRQSVCGACQVNTGCGTAVLDKVLARRQARIKALNPVGARVGDRVQVGLHEQALVRGALGIYGVPVLSMLGLALLGAGVRGDPAYQDAAAIALGLVGLVLGFGWAVSFGRKIAHDARYQPIVVGISGPQCAPSAPLKNL